MGFDQVSGLIKATCIVCVLDVCALLVGAFTTSWITIETAFTEMGLWQTCMFGFCFTMPLNVETLSENIFFTVTRATIAVGCIFGVICVMILVVYVCCKSETKFLRTLAITFAFLTGALSVIGVALFGLTFYLPLADSGAALGWSFAITAAASGLFLIIGILLVVDKMKDNMFV